MTLNISEDFTKELRELTQKFLAIKSRTWTSNFYEGIVEDNNDPRKLGRCRVRVFGQYDKIPVDVIPWAHPDFGIAGEFKVPEVGSIVNVYFRDNEKYSPHYTTMVVNTADLPEERDEDYPNTLVLFKTPNGDYLKINKKTNEITFRHASGGIVTFVENGDVKVDTTHTSSGKVEIVARGNVNITAVGNVSVSSETTINVDAPIIIAPSGNALPVGTGPFCAMPIDPLTGMPQTGFTFTRS